MAYQVINAIIGTAGHIDHGKTALIKALTGQDTDRLKEEKERGISVDLGFAYFTLPDGARAGVVDVPGHERFIRNMLAGAHGIDLVLFTVAADDGVMPQTEEHLDILHLLGIRQGIFVITKADLAGAARLSEVRAEIALLAEGTTLAQAPAIAVSSVTGQGLDELRAAIVRELKRFGARRPAGLFRLPLDRAFVIKGRGLVVTGTAMGATVGAGQKLRVLPAGHEVRVRSIQVHGETVESAGFGQRIALNLAGAERLGLKRGDVLADERLESATRRLDAALELRPAARRPLRNNERIRFFIGASETMGRVIVLEEGGSISPKARGLAQLVLDQPVVALFGDRFVLRDQTNMRTLGGGMTLNPLGARARRPLGAYRGRLATLARASGVERTEALLELLETFAATSAQVAQLLNVTSPEVEQALSDPRFVRFSAGGEAVFTTGGKWEELKRFALSALKAHHAAEPLSPGLEMEALRSRLPYEAGPRAFRAVVDRLVCETGIVREESGLRLASHRAQLGGADARLGALIAELLEKAGFHPPDPRQLAKMLTIPDSGFAQFRSVLGALEREGEVVKVATDLYFGRAAVEAARTRLAESLRREPEITAAAFRDLLGASRKFAIALLDYFDHSGFTIRVGDARRLRARPG